MYRRLADHGAVATLTATCAAMHFAVDGLCLCCLYLMAAGGSAEALVGVFVVYNVMAFLTQPLTGLMADRLRWPHSQLLAAIAMLALAVPLATAVVVVPALSVVRWAVLAVALLLGMGNSMFHVWGGRLVALRSANDMRALGVFVATGAFGLAVAAVLCSWWLLYVLLVALVALAACVVTMTGDGSCADCVSSGSGRSGVYAWAVVAIMLFVMLRSFLAESFAAPVDKSPAVVLVVGLVAMLGKMAGGWLGRWLGVAGALALVAVLVAACGLLRGGGMPVLLAGLFAVNSTMPLTLYLANVVLKGREGLAFGLLAAALMPGYLLAVL
mgnify:CR=1 FL=1